MNTKESMPIIPFKYVCEMICDQLAAGMVYQGKNWKDEYQLNYWKKQRDKFVLNEKIKKFEDIIMEQVAKYGINKVITKENLKKHYIECVGE